MIIIVIIAFVIFYFVIGGRTDKSLDGRTQRHAKIVDDVFFKKDKKIEELEDRINDMQIQRLLEKNK